MIVVIGSPSLQLGDPGSRSIAVGRVIDVARAAIEEGSVVQLVGKVGDDPAGDSLLLAFADDGIGHVAVLRDPARATPLTPATGSEIEPMWAADDERAFDEPGPAQPPGPDAPAGPFPTIDAGDLDLGLRYLPDHRVLVVAEPLEPDALAVVVADCSYVGAVLVLIVEPDAAPPDLPADATAFEAPDSDPDGLFGRTVGRFAAALDRGIPGPAALAQATSGAGWQPTSG